MFITCQKIRYKMLKRIKKPLIGVLAAAMLYTGIQCQKKYYFSNALKETAKLSLDAVVNNPPDIKDNELYMDTHMHLKDPSYYPQGIEEIVETSMKKADIIVVMTHNQGDNTSLDYEKFRSYVKQNPKYSINDYGKYLEIKTENDRLIAIKAQEIRSKSGRDVLAIGCDGTIGSYQDIRDTIKEIHSQNGIAIIAHPMSIQKDSSFFGITLADKEERKELEQLCVEADALEEFNSQNYLWLCYSNVLTEAFAKKHGLSGTAGSDTHFDLKQVGLSGIIIKKDLLHIENLVEDLRKAIKNKNFKNHKEYSDPISFFRIMAFPLLKNKLSDNLSLYTKLEEF
ncbi:hypothetical protein FJZ53_03365 [Candidatus Woesearchaeota archaeon]|nr:hypothetical protein [Candidatus Woesearchaeota archaeon]